MEASKKARIQRQADFISKELRRTGTRAYWLGIALGFIVGLIAGLAIGYSLGSPKTIVIPLEPGVKV